MDTVALLLSRLAFTILIHIIFSGLHTDFLSFGTLPSGSWPFLRPYHRGSCSAAVQPCLHVLGRGCLFVFPLMLLYTAISYSVFRGRSKGQLDAGHIKPGD